MPRQHGFKFTIKGEVFIPRKSNAGADVVDAYSEAVTARKHIKETLSEIPATFEISEPEASSRQAPDLFAKTEAAASAETSEHQTDEAGEAA